MKQNKYIPGDWVKYIGNNSLTYVQIWQVRENFLFLESGYGMVNFSEVEPIPLTPEILERTKKWTKSKVSERTLLYHFGKVNVMDVVDIKYDISGRFFYFAYFIYHENIMELKYVHQLQHLLFGLGLDSNFDLTDTKKGGEK